MDKELGIRETKRRVPPYSLFLLPYSKSGFTFIEILITISILAIIGTITLSALANVRIRRDLDAAVAETASTIRLAQSKTLASESDARYGVHFAEDRVMLFQGISYASGTTTETRLFSPRVRISVITLADGGSDVAFQRLTGTTTGHGLIQLDAGSYSRILTIDPSGAVRTEASRLDPANTRITDSRHVNFQLGWSIQNATSLKLTFLDAPNPNTVETIDMAGFFSADKSYFSWEDAVNVNGSDQTILIHTVSLSAGDTVLSIHRNGSLNSKAVIVSVIDGGVEKEIASYNAAGVVSVGAYGGTMAIQ